MKANKWAGWLVAVVVLAIVIAIPIARSAQHQQNQRSDQAKQMVNEAEELNNEARLDCIKAGESFGDCSRLYPYPTVTTP